jgi:hypothetical protein
VEELQRTATTLEQQVERFHLDLPDSNRRPYPAARLELSTRTARKPLPAYQLQ